MFPLSWMQWMREIMVIFPSQPSADNSRVQALWAARAVCAEPHAPRWICLAAGCSLELERHYIERIPPRRLNRPFKSVNSYPKQIRYC